ncbi:ARID DNA-binding domain-containing protein [Tanacetum coccineum]
MQEVMQYDNTLNHPQPSNTAQNKYKNYKCFQCKQLGHIIKLCPMDNKDEDMPMKTDTKNLARGKVEGFKTTKPIVMLKYPESIYFSTTCMIRDFSVTKLENKMKFLFTYGIGEVLIEDGGQGFIVPGVHYAPEVTLNILLIDLLEKQGFEISCISTSEIARAPQQGCKNTIVESVWKQEDKDRDCLGPHQWDFGENGAPMTRPAVLRGKKTLEDFGVKLEDTGGSQEQPIFRLSQKGQNLHEMYSRPST